MRAWLQFPRNATPLAEEDFQCEQEKLQKQMMHFISILLVSFALLMVVMTTNHLDCRIDSNSVHCSGPKRIRIYRYYVLCF